MINTNSADFERPQVIFQKHSHFDIDSHRFGGKPSYDGQFGGIPLLYDRDKRSMALDPSDSHTIVYGATGSKKTRAFVMPAIKILGHAGESMIINDSKGELFTRLGGELQNEGYEIIAINFRDPAVGNAWNPLNIPYQYYLAGDVDKAAEFANDIANTLMLAEVSDRDPYWDYASSDVCYGLILLLLKYCKENAAPEGSVNIANLTALRRKLYEKGTMSQNTLLWKWASQDELVATSLSGSIMAPKDTMNSILAVFDQKMRSFTIQPTLLDMLANDNIEIGKLGQRKAAVFLVTPDEKTSYHRLVALFISQSYQYLIYTAMQQGGRLPNRINYVLDEFSSLPAIGSDFPSMISAARSRNIRFSIVCQSKNQLIRRYKEEAATITANCTNWVFFASRELDLLRELSELCGQKKDHTPNVSVYDLQQLSKEKNQALLFTGRMKPCLVEFLDIDQFPERKYLEIDFDTPVRTARNKIDFSRFSGDADAGHILGATGQQDTSPSYSVGQGQGNGSGSNEANRQNIDNIIAKIDAKIAQLEAEEAEGKEKTTESIERPKEDTNERVDIDIDRILSGFNAESKDSSMPTEPRLNSLLDAIAKRKDSIETSDEE